MEESGEEGGERGNSGARCHAALCSSGVEHTRTVVYVRRSVGRSVGRSVVRSVGRSVGRWLGRSVGSARCTYSVGPM